MRIGIGPSVVQTQSEFSLGSSLLTGNNSTMSGANSWNGSAFGTYNINTTVAGKMYALGDGGVEGDLAFINILTIGKRYKATLKARLNAGASTTIRAGGSIGGASTRWFEFTPTGTEQTFSGYFTAAVINFAIGLGQAAGGLNGIAFEFDDVVVQEIT